MLSAYKINMILKILLTYWQWLQEATPTSIATEVPLYGPIFTGWAVLA